MNATRQISTKCGLEEGVINSNNFMVIIHGWLLQSPSSTDAADTVTLLNFELVLLFVLCVVVPLIYIGASGELRQDLLR